MKMPVRILLIFLCAALIIALPFAVSSPNMLNNVKMELMNGEDDEDEIDFGRLFFSVAKAEEDEEVEEEVLDEGEFGSHPEWVLPTDFSVVPPAPNADLYTEDGYEDETIRVKIEKTQFDEGTTVIAAYVQIADPCQLRTGVHNTKKLASTPGKSVSFLAKEWNAVIALNGDNYLFEPQKKTFEYRMGNKIKSKGNKTKDILIIDDQGDFHLYVKSGRAEEREPEAGERVHLRPGAGYRRAAAAAGRRLRLQSPRPRAPGRHRPDGKAELRDGDRHGPGPQRQIRHEPGQAGGIHA